MKRTMLAFTFVSLCAMIVSSVAWGRDFFMFDLEKNKILYMGSDDASFVEKMDIEKIPDLIMQTNDPNKFLAIYMPKENLDDGRGHLPIIGEVKDDYDAYKEKGRVLLINIASGRTEDLIDIGVGPFQTSLSKDKKHFVIAYRPDLSSKVYELLHYNIPEKKKEVFKEQLNRINCLDFSTDSSNLFAIAKKSSGDGYEMLTISLNPFKIKSSLPAGFKPYKVYAVSDNRAVILDPGGKYVDQIKSDKRNIRSTEEEVLGSVILVDTEKNTFITSVVFKPSNMNYRWYKEQNTLFVVAGDGQCNWNEALELVWSGHMNFIRVNPDGLKHVEKNEVIWDYQYNPKTDTVYALPERGMMIYDFKNDQESQIKTGINIYNEEYTNEGQRYVRTMNYFVNVIPENNLVTVYSNYKGVIKFYDLKTGKLIQTVKGAKMKGALPVDYGDKASVTTNQDKTRYYVLNRAGKGLKIFNEKMKEISTVDLLGQRPISMYQVEKPVFQTILATDKALYKVEDKGVKEICQFTESVKEMYLFKEDQHLILWTEKEWYILDPATLEMKYHLNEFGDPKDKYTKVKQGERRYFYVPTLGEWSD